MDPEIEYLIEDRAIMYRVTMPSDDELSSSSLSISRGAIRSLMGEHDEASEQLPMSHSQPANGAQKEHLPSRKSKSVFKSLQSKPPRENYFRATRAEIDEIITSRVDWFLDSEDLQDQSDLRLHPSSQIYHQLPHPVDRTQRLAERVPPSGGRPATPEQRYS